MFSKLSVAAATVTLSLSIFIALYYSHARTLFELPLIPGSKDILNSSEVLQVGGAVGPESLAFDGNGEGPYTGVADGRILKWEGDGKGWTDFAVTSSARKDCKRPLDLTMEHVCGRPLGLRFDKKTGDLYIADAYLGLQVAGPKGGLATPLVTEVEGQPLLFTNDVDIDDRDDVIYFTDSSTQFQRREFMSSLLSIDKTGRLMKYEKSSKEVTVLLRGLHFANGVALSKDGSFVLVAETSACRILRLWLRGPDAEKVDTFAELPGFPDNVRRNSEGEFWVALHSKTTPFAKLISSNFWIGKMLLKLPLSLKQLHSLFVGGKSYAVAVKLNDQGEILEVLEDVEGNVLRFISEMEERDGKLWLGSVLTPFVGKFSLS